MWLLCSELTQMYTGCSDKSRLNKWHVYINVSIILASLCFVHFNIKSDICGIYVICHIFRVSQRWETVQAVRWPTGQGSELWRDLWPQLCGCVWPDDTWRVHRTTGHAAVFYGNFLFFTIFYSNFLVLQYSMVNFCFYFSILR